MATVANHDRPAIGYLVAWGVDPCGDTLSAVIAIQSHDHMRSRGMAATVKKMRDGLVMAEVAVRNLQWQVFPPEAVTKRVE